MKTSPQDGCLVILITIALAVGFFGASCLLSMALLHKLCAMAGCAAGGFPAVLASLSMGAVATILAGAFFYSAMAALGGEPSR
jgi:hypothetical protein